MDEATATYVIAKLGQALAAAEAMIGELQAKIADLTEGQKEEAVLPEE